MQNSNFIIMTKIHFYLIIILLLFCSSNSWASVSADSIHAQYFSPEVDCDACGCSVSAMNSGIESLIENKFVGIRYLYQHYHAQEDAFSKQLSQKQHFQTTMIWMRFPLNDRMVIAATIPYHFHEKKGRNNDKINGFGDVNLTTIVQVLKTKSSEEKQMHHQLSLASGLKIPVAKFDEKSTETSNPSFQLGTGSWDTQLALHYHLQYQNNALQLITDYTIKSENKKKYRFGNQWNQLLQMQRFFPLENGGINAKIGFQNEIYEANKQFGEKIPKTKGDLQLMKYALELSHKKINLGLEYYQTLSSNLNAGEVEAKNRMGVFVNYAL